MAPRKPWCQTDQKWSLGVALTVHRSDRIPADVLVHLRATTATEIDAGLSAREYPVHVRLLHEIIQSIAAIDAQDRADSEAVGLEDEPLDPEDI